MPEPKTNTDKQRAIHSARRRLQEAGMSTDRADKMARDSFEKVRQAEIKRERDRR